MSKSSYGWLSENQFSSESSFINNMGLIIHFTTTVEQNRILWNTERERERESWKREYGVRQALPKVNS